ncbi:sigma-70 family RNA polymerase sigma factor [Paenibacillus oleatilyticus]|uniref:Sigma-70 family RNA polymerase sigma factor n=1 Tax=Paenibacillus oleatilyticus TaxID=2594886 RepID=A0ABV4UX84_9BACL
MCAVRLHDFNPHLGYKEDVVRSSTPLVVATARGFAWAVGKCGIDMDDLISEAWIGFLKAFDRFDPVRFTGVKQFSTYAVPLMRYQVLDFLQGKAVTLKVPAKVYRLAGKVLRGGLSDASENQAAEQLGCTKEAVREVQRYLHDEKPVFLDQPLPGKDGEDRSGYDLLKSNQDITTVHVREFVASLDEQDRQLLNCQIRGMTLVEIATALKIHIDEALGRMESIRERCKAYFEVPEREGEPVPTLTKEKYVELKEQGVSDDKILSSYKMGSNTLSRRKKEWGIPPLKKGGDMKTKAARPAVLHSSPAPVDRPSPSPEHVRDTETIRLLQERLERVEHENGLLRSLLKNYL